MAVNKSSQLAINQGIPSIEDELRALGKQGPVQGKAIHELFNRDVFIADAVKTAEKEPLSPSFWSKIAPLWLPNEIQPISTAPVSKTMSDLAIQKAEPIRPVPELDKPELPGEASLEGSVPKIAPQSLKGDEVKMTEKEILKGLAMMDDKTVEQIMTIVLKAQLEIERDNAEISNDSFTQLQNLRKIQERTLDEIRQALEKDKRLAGYFNTTQCIALGAAAICGIATVAVTAGVAIPFVVAAAKFSAIFSAAVTAITAGGQGYTKVRSNENQATLTTHKHGMQRTNDLADDYREQMTKSAENNGHFQDELVKILKRLEKMKNMVLQG